MTLRDPSVHGGNGYAAAALRNQGYEQAEGAIGSRAVEFTVKKKRTRKTKIIGGANLGLADIETEPRGDPPLPGPLEKTAPKASKSKLDDITLKAPTSRKSKQQVIKPEETVIEAKTEDVNVGSGGSKKKRVNAYALLAKEVMQKNNFKKLADASKFIKDNNLYTKK